MKSYFEKALEQFKIDFQDRNLMIFYDELSTDEAIDQYLNDTFAKSTLPKTYAVLEEDDLKALFCEQTLYDLALKCVNRRKNLWGEEYEPILYWLKKGQKNILSQYEDAKDIFNSIKTAQAFVKKYCKEENKLPLLLVSPCRSKILKSRLVPLRECAGCHKIALATYSVKRGLGVHSIKSLCLNQDCLHAIMGTNRELLRYCMAYLENASSNISSD